MAESRKKDSSDLSLSIEVTENNPHSCFSSYKPTNFNDAGEIQYSGFSSGTSISTEANPSSNFSSVGNQNTKNPISLNEMQNSGFSSGVNISTEANPSSNFSSVRNQDTNNPISLNDSCISSEANPSSNFLSVINPDTNIDPERVQKVIKLMTEMFVQYFNPNEILNRLDNLDDNEQLSIREESLCDTSRGMRGLLETLEDSDECIIEFFELITTLDRDSEKLPLALLSGDGKKKHEEISSIVDLIVELVEQKNISKLTTDNVKTIFDEMVKRGLFKKTKKTFAAKDNPVESFMDLLGDVRKNNLDWSFILWEIMMTTRPNLFGSELEEINLSSHGSVSNQSSLNAMEGYSLPSNEQSPTDAIALATAASSSETTTQTNDAMLSAATTQAVTSVAAAVAKRSAHAKRDLDKLHVTLKNRHQVKMFVDSGALHPSQIIDSEVECVRNKHEGAWTDNHTDFSDGEDEETERKQVVVDDQNAEKDLELREYQNELCEAALAGSNTIICAPTGSGKTRVVMKIIIEHLKDGSPSRKVCFFARTVPLARQQFNTIAKYLPKPYTVDIFTGETEASIDMHLLLPDLNVVVLTPMILQNHINKGNIKDLSVFSLLVFDECHHTRELETYMILMASYLDEKVKTKGPSSKKLPQIVGLTASFPVGKANNVTEAKQSILNLCANLDAKMISTVEKNRAEMEKWVHLPTEKMEYLEERDSDESFKKISNVMEMLEKEAEDFAKDIKDEEIIRKIAAVPSENRKLQRYNNWTVDVENCTVVLPRSVKETNMSARLLMITAQYLSKYHFALETHDLVHLMDVIGYLENCFAEFKPEAAANEGEVRLFGYFEELRKSMKKLGHHDNPNLHQLVRILVTHLNLEKNDSLSRGIIFVRTRAIAEALVSWLNRCNHKEVRCLKACIFTGTNAKESLGGMTPAQQNSLVQAFRDGKVRLLVATSVAEEGMDVPECNLVIKYNHVGNEITTIQARGRSRKKGGHSVLLAMQNICEKERLNQKRTELMYKGIKAVIKMDRNEFLEEVWKIQINDAEERKIKAMIEASKREEFKNKRFTMYCKLCKKFSIKSEDIRLVCNNFRVVINGAWDRGTKKIFPAKPRYIDETYIVGGVKCCCQIKDDDPTRCNGSLGAFISYYGIYFLAVGIKNFIVEEEGKQQPRAVKKWKDLPYPIEELTKEDIRNYLKPKNSGGVQETECHRESYLQSFATSISCLPSSVPCQDVVGSFKDSFISNSSFNETARKEIVDNEMDSGLVDY